MSERKDDKDEFNMPLPNYGQATRVTETAATAITSANAAVIGVLFCGSGTGSVQLFRCATTASATATADAVLTGVVRFMTSATGTGQLYREIPAYAPGGIVVNVGASPDPDLTIFWNPTGES